MTVKTALKTGVRQPKFADDMWYSSNRRQLRSDIQEYLNQAPPQPGLNDNLVGLIVPHAGYLFSGHVAATAFVNLKPGLFNTVILLGPDHRGAAPGQIATPDVETWHTPLGNIPVAWDILETLTTDIDLAYLESDKEHSLEIELPFLQVALNEFRLVPLLMGTHTPDACQALVAALRKALDTVQPGPVLLVASSDLSHFFREETARQLDRDTLQFILDLNAEGLLNHVQTGHRHDQPLACGPGPMATVIELAKTAGANHAHLLKYATSAEVHPRRDSVVGYAAVALTKPA